MSAGKTHSKCQNFVSFFLRNCRAVKNSPTKLLVALALASTPILFSPLSVSSAHATASGLDTTCAALDGVTPVRVSDRSTSTITLAVGDTLTVFRTTSNAAIALSSSKAVFDLTEADVEIRSPSNALLKTVAVGATQTQRGTEAGDYKVNIGSGAYSHITISCTVETYTASDVQESFTETQVVNQLSTLYDRMSQNARGSLDGTASNSISGQGFNLNADAIRGVGYNEDTGYSDFNIWAGAEFNIFNATTIDGYTADLVAGIDYKFNDSLLYGVLVGYGKTDFDTLVDLAIGKLEASAITGGIYGAKKLQNGLTFDALLAYTKTEYDVISGIATGSFDAKRVGFSAGVYNSFDYNTWVIEPRAKLIIAREQQDAYTDSEANAIAARSITSGRFAFGPKVYFDKDGEFSPWASIDLEYDFSNSSAVVVGAPKFDGSISARTAVGFNYLMDEQTQVQFNANVGGLGSDAYTSYGLQVELNRSF